MKRKASLSWKEKAVFVEGKQPFLFCLDIFHLEGSLFTSQGIVATRGGGAGPGRRAVGRTWRGWLLSGHGPR